MSHNRLHPAHFEESLKITVRPIEHGDDCAYLVYIAGHGAIQEQFALDKDAVKARIAVGLEDWKAYCVETREAQKLERHVIDGAVDLPE